MGHADAEGVRRTTTPEGNLRMARNHRTADNPTVPAPRRRPKPNRSTCPATGKVRFRDAREADDALHGMWRAASEADAAGARHTYRARRKYSCLACSGWHLTSWESAGSPGPGASSHGLAA
jgi:hypothetical protein